MMEQKDVKTAEWQQTKSCGFFIKNDGTVYYKKVIK